MRTEKQIKQLEEARKRIKNRACSEETKRKIGAANDGNFFAVCDYCGKKYHTKKSHYQKSKRRFCSRECYSKYRKDIMPKEEHYAYGTGMSQQEKDKRKRARSTLNHYLRDKKIQRMPCEICGDKKAEAHHDDYDKPLDIRWLCKNCHRKWHKEHDNPELLEVKE